MKNEKRHLTGDGVLYAIKTGIEDYYNFNGSPVKNSERIKIINEIIENCYFDTPWNLIKYFFILNEANISITETLQCILYFIEKLFHH